MKINWKVRLMNPMWWIGLAGVVLTAMHVTPEMFTDWSIVGAHFMALAQNPFLLVSVIVAVVGYNTDHTTAGLGDSERAMRYVKPGQLGEVQK